MKIDKKVFTFDKSEIFIIFLLFIFSAVLVFSIGIMIGKKLLENECKIMLEDTEKSLKDCLTNNNKDLSIDATITQDTKPSILSSTASESKELNNTDLVKKDEITNKTENSNKGLELKISEISSDLKDKFTIQVSAFQIEAEAKKFSFDLYQKGQKSVYYIPVQIPGKGTWYRVNIGFFPKKNSAEVYSNMLKKQGLIDSYIIRQL